MKTGYGRNIDKVQGRHDTITVDLGTSGARSGKGGLYSAFNAVSPDPFAATTEADLKPVSLFDVKPDLKAELPVVKAVTNTNVNEAAVKPQSVAQDRKQLDGAVNDYTKANKAVIQEFMAALKDVDPEVHKYMGAKLKVSAMSSTIEDVFNVVNPVGDLAVIAAALKKKPNDQQMLAAFDKTQSVLQQRTEHVAKQTVASATGPAPTNWAAFKKPEQLMEFINRDINQDDWMKKANKVDVAVTGQEKNIENFDKNYGNNVTAGKLAKAINAGDDGLVKELLKGDEERIAIAKVDVGAAARKELPVRSSDDVRGIRGSTEMRGAQVPPTGELSASLLALHKELNPASSVSAPAPKFASEFNVTAA